jgi:hypothetical protein
MYSLFHFVSAFQSTPRGPFGTLAVMWGNLNSYRKQSLKKEQDPDLERDSLSLDKNLRIRIRVKSCRSGTLPNTAIMRNVLIVHWHKLHWSCLWFTDWTSNDWISKEWTSNMTQRRKTERWTTKRWMGIKRRKRLNVDWDSFEIC